MMIPYGIPSKAQAVAKIDMIPKDPNFLLFPLFTLMYHMISRMIAGTKGMIMPPTAKK